MTKADIYRDDMKLYMAIRDYEKKYVLPFSIPSERRIARETFERLMKTGLEGASRPERMSAQKLFRRMAATRDL